MSTVVMLGGNGYLGRNVTEKWLAKDPEARFVVVSRSGKNALENERITNVQADCTDVGSVRKVLPEQVDYIVDFVGRPEEDPDAFRKINDQPADVMLEIAKEKNVKAMGMIGGVLGPKTFVEGKKRIIDKLKASGIRTEYVEPTLVYGNGRKDSMTKMVPLLKFFGVFSKKMKPVDVNDVADELVGKMVTK
ncbi:MAG: NAD-dependent epimerase/dehydratase family protein [Anaerovoracaceae bacterium]|jgi:UDP-glucose 4-epimerase